MNHAAFNLYPWQQKTWQLLQGYILQQRVPQALLVSGHQGIGKAHLAAQIANALLCDKPQNNGIACGECKSCQLLKAQTHPDLMMVSFAQDAKSGKVKTNIDIEQIRNLVALMQLKPQFEKYRVIIINPADAFNLSSANAFLKYLEEPAERTLLILISAHLHKILPTIKSRCQKLPLPMPEYCEVVPWLEKQCTGFDSNQLLNLAQGSPLLALSYANAVQLKQRQSCFEDWLNVAQQKIHPVEVAGRWLEVCEERLLFWLMSWVIDLTRHCYLAAPAKLFNADFGNEFAALAKKLPVLTVMKFYDLLIKRKQQLNVSLNKQVFWEELLIAWAKLNQEKISHGR